jgi:hypothetical protein
MGVFFSYSFRKNESPGLRSYSFSFVLLIILVLAPTGADNFYNPQNPGFVLSGSFVLVGNLNLQTGDFIAHGVPVHITVPGHGAVYLRAGYWASYPNGHLAGIDSFENPADLAVFCSILAGQYPAAGLSDLAPGQITPRRLGQFWSRPSRCMPIGR